MPVFTLKKYDDTNSQVSTSASADDVDKQQEKQKEKEITIGYTDTVSSIVARALYTSLDVRQEELTSKEASGEVTTQIVSTEDINKDPLKTLQLCRGKKAVVIVNEGFKTKEEDWYLMSLESMNVPVYYSLESYLKSLTAQRGN